MLLASPLGQTVTASDIVSELTARNYHRESEIVPPEPPLTRMIVPTTPPVSPPISPPAVTIPPFIKPEPPPAILPDETREVNLARSVKYGVDEALKTLNTMKSYGKVLSGKYYIFVDPTEFDRIIGDAYNSAYNHYYRSGGDPSVYTGPYWIMTVRKELTGRSILRLTEPYPKPALTPTVTPIVEPPVEPVVKPIVKPVIPWVEADPYVPFIPEVPDYIPEVTPAKEVPKIEPVDPVLPIIEPFVPTPDVVIPVIPEEVITPVIPDIIPTVEELEPVIPELLEPFIWRRPIPAVPVTPPVVIEEKPDRSNLFLLLFGAGLVWIAMQEKKPTERRG